MNITIEQKKQKAIEIMNTLNLYKPYIKGFEQHNDVCYYEEFGGFWTYQEPELQEKIETFEKEHDCLVYAVTHEYTEFGELYDFLIVTDYEEEWDTLLEKTDRYYYVFAYVWNKDDDTSLQVLLSAPSPKKTNLLSSFFLFRCCT